jgi:hypothetical protein
MAAVLAALAMAGAHPPAFASAKDSNPAEAAIEARAEAAGERLGDEIQRAIRAGGPFFTAEERAVIERACGYPAGSYDGFEANMSDGVFTCTNGRRADSAEVRAVMAAAGPRIGARVAAAMDRPEVRAAIERVASEASAAALAAIDQAEIAREVAAATGEATREAMAEAERAIAEARREVAEATREAQRAAEEARRERRR